ncbi:hypothetical protein VR41_07085 [Streptomyces sp. NRRL B-1568]|nr:hypothetical protein VR41_07085 [Streptomyces sp. NRRL B-1568]
MNSIPADGLGPMEGVHDLTQGLAQIVAEVYRTAPAGLRRYHWGRARSVADETAQGAGQGGIPCSAR